MSSSSSFRIEIEELTVGYPGRDYPALNAVSETIDAGETVVITGPSGCGKSTLCRTLAGFIPEMIPARVAGDVRIGGTSLWSTDVETLAENVGFVQQDADSQICTLNVWQEVAFGPENLCLPVGEVRDRVEEALRLVEIDHLRNRQTTSLSGGEKQRLAIASILVMRPSILLLDEPTANLDPQGARRILALLGRLTRDQGMTLVVVEHRIRPILSLDPRLVVLDRGQVVERHRARRRWDLGQLSLRDVWSVRRGSSTPRRRDLAARGLSFGYEKPLFEGLSFRVSGGEILGVIGPNGGGKTSLLRLVAGLEAPHSGGIVGAEHASIGFAFQHPHHQIFERTVERELRLDGSLSDDALTERLRRSRLDGLAKVPPLSLSLGEQRRLTLMTALARRPDLLLLDEPFIGQDRRNVAWIIEQICAVRDRGGIVIIVSHDIPLIGALADRLLYLHSENTVFGEPDRVFDRLRQTGNDAFCPEESE